MAGMQCPVDESMADTEYDPLSLAELIGRLQAMQAAGARAVRVLAGDEYVELTAATVYVHEAVVVVLEV